MIEENRQLASHCLGDHQILITVIQLKEVYGNQWGELIFRGWIEKLNPFTPKSAKFKTEEEILNFFLQHCQKQRAPLEGTAR